MAAALRANSLVMLFGLRQMPLAFLQQQRDQVIINRDFAEAALGLGRLEGEAIGFRHLYGALNLQGLGRNVQIAPAKRQDLITPRPRKCRNSNNREVHCAFKALEERL